MEHGTILATRGVADEMKENPAFAQEVIAAFNRYRKNDWGDLCQEDKDLNDLAARTGERILPHMRPARKDLDYYRMG